MSVVVLQKGNDRCQNIRQALELLRSEISKKIKKFDKIVIKPNFVSVRIPLCATHVIAVKALLDFLIENGLSKNRKMIIAEGAAVGETFDGFDNYGYFQTLKNYPVEFRDLNKDEAIEIELLDG